MIASNHADAIERTGNHIRQRPTTLKQCIRLPPLLPLHNRLPLWPPNSQHCRASTLPFDIISKSSHRIFDDRLQRRKSIGQGSRPRLQDQRRFDLMQRAAADSRYAIKPRPLSDLLGAKLLAAPGADNNIRLASDYFFRRHHTILGRFARGTIGKDVEAAGGLNQLRYPSDAGNHRIVPFLEIDLRPPWQLRRENTRAGNDRRQFVGQPIGASRGPEAGVFAEGAALAVASALIAKLRNGGKATEYGGFGTCYVEFGGGRIGKVEVDFFSGPSPTGKYYEPSTDLRAEKELFGSSRRARWFGL